MHAAAQNITGQQDVKRESQTRVARRSGDRDGIARSWSGRGGSGCGRCSRCFCGRLRDENGFVSIPKRRNEGKKARQSRDQDDEPPCARRRKGRKTQPGIAGSVQIVHEVEGQTAEHGGEAGDPRGGDEGEARYVKDAGLVAARLDEAAGRNFSAEGPLAGGGDVSAGSKSGKNRFALSCWMPALRPRSRSGVMRRLPWWKKMDGERGRSQEPK
jgi:hypothetical protein